MSKITLNPVANLIDATTAAATINANSTTIQNAFDNTLSRDGTQPNTMSSVLDMNSHSIVNLPAPVASSSPLRLQDATLLNGSGTISTIPSGGTTGQVLAKNTSANYDTAWVAPSTNVVPTGGTVGQIIVKNSGANFDMSWANNTNNVIVAPAGGRLTLASGIPVMNSSVTNATTVYYAPYVSKFIPINISGILALSTFTSSSSDSIGLSVALGSNWLANSNYDWFVFSNAGTITLGSGPDWSAGAVAGSNNYGGSVRGTGAGSTSLAMFNGLMTNANSITLRTSNATTVVVPANQASYVGTTRTIAAGQVSFTYGSVSSGGGAANLHVWNAYNQVPVYSAVGDSTASWTYGSTTIREANNSTGNRANFITGLAQSNVDASMEQLIRASAVVSAFSEVGLAMNSTTVFDKRLRVTNPVSSGSLDGCVTVRNVYTPLLGANFVSSNEAGDGSNTNTFFGTSFFNLCTSLLM